MRIYRCCVIVIVLVELLCLFSQSQTLTCHPHDLEALRDFIANLDPKPDGWLVAVGDANSSSADCCSWDGVTCNFSDSNNIRRVTKLELMNKQLSGKLSDSLGKLDQIRVLNLSRNFIKDSIPLSIFNMLNLETLDLSSNDLDGEIPKTINLPSLTTLDLSSNQFNGAIPAQICHNSTQINVIKLEINYFAGDFISGFGKCVLLEHLSLGTNNLAGNIHEDLFHLKWLNLLEIQENRLSGSLNPAIGNFSNLIRLDISQNMFSGDVPDVFDEMPKLKYLLAESNKFTGGIPKSLGNSKSLNFLNLRNNSFSGPLRLNCSMMSGLNSLDLGVNKFNGSLPDNLPVCKSLKNVNLGRNAFHGQVPESFKNFQSLSYFSLSNSSLVNISATLEILQECKNLTTLILTSSFHGEMLPDDTSLHFEKLKVLVVANCRLTGSIPSCLSQSSDLQLLDLSWNHLTGTIPNWIGSFKHLFYLDLSNNSFTGEIPKSLTELQSLSSKGISFDEPSTGFPFFRKRNDESARALQYNQILGFRPTIGLHQNNLSGPIWEEFGNLKNLHVFDLKMNNLSGSIPSTLSGMISLEVLDLSNNHFSGSIPNSFKDLSLLSKFSVANNNLSGRIPSGGQFQTFPNSSFESNNFYGDNWFPKAADTSDEKSKSAIKRPRTKVADIGMVIAMDIGIATGLLLTIVALIVLRARRRS